MLNEVFLPMNLDFLNQRLGSQHNVKHFFANWEQCNIASALSIAVATDNQTTWDFAIDYFKNGVGNGAINNAISNIVKEPGTGKPLGQGQESGREVCDRSRLFIHFHFANHSLSPEPSTSRDTIWETMSRSNHIQTELCLSTL